MEPDVDPKTGQVRTRWGGRMMKHPVTGKEVPDPSDQKVIYRYLNPRPAEWPEADYVVSNPPFIGNARMREALGDGYTETLRGNYTDVSETVDYVMYWWHKAANYTRHNRLRRFGFITTNSVRQIWQRKVIEYHLKQKNSIRLFFVIPDHPWDQEGAAVRIAMTAAEVDDSKTPTRFVQVGTVTYEAEAENPEEQASLLRLELKNVARIFSNLDTGVDVSIANKIQANKELSSKGMMLAGKGFLLEQEELLRLGYSSESYPKVIKKYRNGRDLILKGSPLYVIDLFGLNENDVRDKYPEIYQWILERVKPERDTNNRKSYRDNWWVFAEPRARIRPALENLERYIATPRTTKHRFFIFLNSDVLPESEVIMIALEDAYFLGILSSCIHVRWALAAGGDLGGNTPRYNNSVCFDPFPFPDPTPEQKQKIRELGERLDAHRKRVQAAHPDITITGMYNLLEKLRAGQPLTDKDREYNNRALVSTLKQIHDELDTAVLDAYGWPHDITDEQILERLVALNAERAAEERNGHIRWLRPDYQAPATQATQTAIANLIDSPEPIAPAAEPQPWPTQPKAQLAAIRDLLRSNPGHWSIDQIAAQFKGKITDKRRQTIRENLDRLEWFGLAIQQDNTWHYAAPSAIA
jgi:hypothetical protein